MAPKKNNGKPLKLIYLQNLKQNVDSDWFWVADNEYDYIQVIIAYLAVNLTEIMDMTEKMTECIINTLVFLLLL